MKTKFFAAFWVAMAMCVSTSAYAVSVDFGSLSGTGDPIAVTDQYESDNVLFSGLIADDKCSGDYCGVLSQNYNTPVEIVFGNSTQDGIVDAVTIVMEDGAIGTSVASYTAYDIDGNVLGSATVVATGGEQSFQIAYAGIHRIVLDDGDGDGSLFHGLSYDGIQLSDSTQRDAQGPHMPEPSAALLFGLGAFVLSRRTRRA